MGAFPPSGWPRRALARALALVVLSVATHGLAAAQDAPQAVQQGARLFLGTTRFANGGPPCGACHRIAALPFPNGGTLGPDLSTAYQMLGDEGTALTLQTLFFPTMMPLYEKRPLAAGEQAALRTLLEKTAPPAPAVRDTATLAGVALAGCLVLVALTWLAWRHRLRGVRAALVARAAAGGARS